MEVKHILLNALCSASEAPFSSFSSLPGCSISHNSNMSRMNSTVLRLALWLKWNWGQALVWAADLRVGRQWPESMVFSLLDSFRSDMLDGGSPLEQNGVWLHHGHSPKHIWDLEVHGGMVSQIPVRLLFLFFSDFEKKTYLYWHWVIGFVPERRAGVCLIPLTLGEWEVSKEWSLCGAGQRGQKDLCDGIERLLLAMRASSCSRWPR